MVGTPHYMAPEQVRGDKIDPRADLYALGATLYEMLTGRTPHSEAPDCVIALATLSEPITPVRALRPDCPEALEQLVMRALAREPSDRFASAREMRSALDQCQTVERVPAEPPRAAVLEDTFRMGTFVPPASQPRSKLRQRAGLVAAGLALMGGLALAQQPAARSLLDANAQPLAGSGVQAGQASLLEPLSRTGELATKLALQTSAGAVQLFDRVHASAEELLQVVRNPTGWGAELGAPAGQR
jgi:hypothetical protein